MPESESIHRHFMGAASPALPVAARWLIDALPGGAGALGEALVVVPGSRAQRRLMELLAQRSEGRAIEPPTIVTLGGLADRLMHRDGPALAGGIDVVLAWSSVLREAEGAVLSAVVPHAPGREDWPGWWALAEEVVQLAEELGAQLMLVQDAAERLAHRADAARWEALAELDRRVHALLAERGAVDKHAARREAIENQSCAYAGPIVLVATADLQPVHEQMLACVAAPVYALVFADEQDAEGFDALGGFVRPYWAGRALGIDDAALSFVDRPGDQASAVLSAVGDWAAAQDTSADMITVGLGDASLNGPVARTLDLSGLPVRSALGKPMGRARPVLLLRALAEFANGLRFDKLAALLRHPDMEAYVARQTPAPTTHWLTLLDQYATDHLAARPVGGWLGKPETVRAMDAVYQSATSLLPEPINGLRPLGQWAGPIGQVLAAVYGERLLNRFAQTDRPVVATLEAVGGVLDRLTNLDENQSPHCTFAHAVTFVVKRLAGQLIPEPGGEPAIELVGFLELLLDDAPHMVITGMNEQHVPEPARTSALLPEGVRQSLGLPDDTHRLARDGYALSAILRCRAPGAVRLVAGRRSLVGDPLLPSRLLLRADDATLVRRVSDYVAEQGETHVKAPMVLTPGRSDRFLIPRPVLPEEQISRLSVTAFRDYLACPYRFYLKHVRRLETVDDRALEISARHFGVLAHRALQILAGPDLRGLDDAGAIAERLGMALDHAFVKSFGNEPPIAARIQAEQLRYRLSSFAPVQAALVREGWRIIHQEQRYETTIRVDGEPFTIKGQIDRIDQRDDGRFRIIDYKTADSAKRPEQTHRKTEQGERVWIDLQLPLYLDLLAGRVDRSAELGYINLPKQTGQTAYSAAEWSAEDLDSAKETRDDVIRQVRAGVFWPPREPPVFDDGLAGVCGDEAMDRLGLIRASGVSSVSSASSASREEAGG